MNETFPAKAKAYEVICVLGKKIRTTNQYFNFIVDFKHGELRNKIDEVLKTFVQADEVRRNKEHPEIHLYYRKINRHWICAVARHLNNQGFLITAYITSKFRRKGEEIWVKEK